MSDDSLVQNAFVAGLLTFPLVLCRLAFDYMVHVQFGMEADFTGSHVLTHTGPAVISVFALSMSTERFKKSKYAQFLYFAASVYIGCLVIYYSNEDGTFGAMQKTPGLITAGVLLVIQMDLTAACVAVAFCLIFCYRNSIYLSGGVNLNTEL